jgi:hypothetical protein
MECYSASACQSPLPVAAATELPAQTAPLQRACIQVLGTKHAGRGNTCRARRQSFPGQHELKIPARKVSSFICPLQWKDLASFNFKTWRREEELPQQCLGGAFGSRSAFMFAHVEPLPMPVHVCMHLPQVPSVKHVKCQAHLPLRQFQSGRSVF